MKRTHNLFLILLLSFILGDISLAEDDFRKRAHQKSHTGNTVEDVEAEVHFGKTIAARILGQFHVYDDEKLTRYVNLVGKSLAMNASRNDITFSFAVLDADFINAYSAPGGYVFITKGAIQAMQDEAELAAVLAHEVAHITEKHIVKEFKIKGKERSATAGLSQLLSSSQSSTTAIFSQAVDNAVKLLMNTGFKEKDEYESDEVAVMLLAATGYDPTALRRYLKRTRKLENKANKASTHKPTHPPTFERLSALKKTVKKNKLHKLKLPKGKIRFSKYAIK